VVGQVAFLSPLQPCCRPCTSMPRDAHRCTRRHTPRSRSTERAQPRARTASPQQLLRHTQHSTQPAHAHAHAHAAAAAAAAATHTATASRSAPHSTRSPQRVAHTCSNMTITMMGLEQHHHQHNDHHAPGADASAFLDSRPSKEAQLDPRKRPNSTAKPRKRLAPTRNTDPNLHSTRTQPAYNSSPT
jgi:hypothetical protein